MNAPFVVYISDTIHGSFDRRTYRTYARAMARFQELRASFRRNGRTGVVLSYGGTILNFC